LISKNYRKDAKEHLAEVATSQGVVLKMTLHIIAQKQMVLCDAFVYF
jgi:hypothetical protein